MDALKIALANVPSLTGRARVLLAEQAHARGDAEDAARHLDEETCHLARALAALVSPPDYSAAPKPTEISERMALLAAEINGVAFLRTWWVQPTE